jgi:hypothetical protein
MVKSQNNNETLRPTWRVHCATCQCEPTFILAQVACHFLLGHKDVVLIGNSSQLLFCMSFKESRKPRILCCCGEAAVLNSTVQPQRGSQQMVSESPQFGSHVESCGLQDHRAGMERTKSEHLLCQGSWSGFDN